MSKQTVETAESELLTVSEVSAILRVDATTVAPMGEARDI